MIPIQSTKEAQMRRRVLIATAAFCAVPVILLIAQVTVIKANASSPNTSLVSTAKCADDVHFYSEDVVQNFDGPPVTGELAEVLQKLHVRRCGDDTTGGDPALVQQHGQYQAGNFQTPEVSLSNTYALMNDRKLWRETVALMEIAESRCTPSLETMSGPYQTLYFAKTKPIPSTYQDAPDRPEFRVLRFSCPDGKQYNYKLDCGFQPVDQDFPGVPVGPPGITVTTVPGVTVTTGQTVTTPTQVTVTTRVTTTTGCPLGPNGCKPYVPPSSIVCGQPSNPCNPGLGPSVPNTPDPSQPQASVAPTSSRVPPTQVPPPTDPPVTNPISTINSVPQ